MVKPKLHRNGNKIVTRCVFILYVPSKEIKR